MLRELFNSLYRQFGRRILKLLLKRNGGDFDAAEQVLQDTFIAAFSSYRTFNHKSSYLTWLCKIALNKLADYYRHQVHYRSKVFIPTAKQLDSLISPDISLEEKVSLDELRQAMNKSMDLLPPEYRRLLHLKYYRELSSRQICMQMNLTPRKLEGRLYRARHALATVISRRFPHLKP
jgi:RNA polymerase sigma factor (sigma-70 family)